MQNIAITKYAMRTGHVPHLRTTLLRHRSPSIIYRRSYACLNPRPSILKASPLEYFEASVERKFPSITRGNTTTYRLDQDSPTQYKFPDAANYEINVRRRSGAWEGLTSWNLAEALKEFGKPANFLLRSERYRNKHRTEYKFKQQLATRHGTLRWDSDETPRLELSAKQVNNSGLLRILLAGAYNRIQDHGAIEIAIKAMTPAELDNTIRENPHLHCDAILSAMPKGTLILVAPQLFQNKVSWTLGIPGTKRLQEGADILQKEGTTTLNHAGMGQNRNGTAGTERLLGHCQNTSGEDRYQAGQGSSFNTSSNLELETAMPSWRHLPLNDSSATQTRLIARKMYRGQVNSGIKGTSAIESKQRNEVEGRLSNESGEKAANTCEVATSIEILGKVDWKARTAAFEEAQQSNLPEGNALLRRPRIKIVGSDNPNVRRFKLCRG